MNVCINPDVWCPQKSSCHQNTLIQVDRSAIQWWTEGAEELGISIFPIYSLFNGEPRTYLEFSNHLIEWHNLDGEVSSRHDTGWGAQVLCSQAPWGCATATPGLAAWCGGVTRCHGSRSTWLLFCTEGIWWKMRGLEVYSTYIYDMYIYIYMYNDKSRI